MDIAILGSAWALPALQILKGSSSLAPRRWNAFGSDPRHTVAFASMFLWRFSRHFAQVATVFVPHSPSSSVLPEPVARMAGEAGSSGEASPRFPKACSELFDCPLGLKQRRRHAIMLEVK